ncbi:UNVERIFIED_CONTAM: hypothetical protein FKN15_031647 [Acipenser sinensis]
MIEQITRNAVAQGEQLERWGREMGLAPQKRREPTELELLLQEWEQASGALQPPEPEGEELPLLEPRGEEPPLPEPKGEKPPLPEPRGEEPPLPEPRREEPPLPEPRGEEPLLPEPRGEAKSIPPPQPRPPPLRYSSASLRPAPRPLLLDTLSVSLDLPSLDLEPRSRQKRSQVSSWFPAPLLPDTETSLRCSQTSLTLPLVTASLPLSDRTSLHWVPAADLCPLLQPPVPRLSFRSPLTNRWGPSSPPEWEEPERPQPEWEEPERPQPEWEEPERPQPEWEEPEGPQPEWEDPERPKPEREELVRPWPEREESVHPRPKREESVRPRPEREESVPSPPAGEDYLLFPPPPAEEDYLLVPPPPEWEDCLWLPPPLWWEDYLSLPPAPAEGEQRELSYPPTPTEDAGGPSQPLYRLLRGAWG